MLRYVLALFSALLCMPLLALAQPSPVTDADVTLEWTAPTQNTDGSPLTDLARYNIYASSSLTTPPVPLLLGSVGASALTFTTPPLVEGQTYTFHVTAVDTSGNESAPSATVSAFIPVGVDVISPDVATVVGCEKRLTLSTGTVLRLPCE